MKTPIIVTMAALLLCSSAIPSQARGKKVPLPERRPFSNVALSLDLSTFGPGISAVTPIHRDVSLKASYYLMPVFSSMQSDDDYPIALLPRDRAIEMPFPESRTAFNSHVFKLAVDWVPGNQGRSIFYLSGGIILQNTKTIWYRETYDTSVLHDLGLSPEEIQDVHIINGYGEYRLGNDSKVEHVLYRPPFGLYFGIGVGRPIPKRRVGFRAELGLPLYIGTTRVSADGWESSHIETIFTPFSFSPGIIRRGITPSLCLTFQVTVKLFRDREKMKSY